MAHFYGTLQGARGQASRCGSRSSGIRASAQSYSGSVVASLEDTIAGTRAEVSIADGSSSSGRVIYSGPLSWLVEASRDPGFALKLAQFIAHHATAVRRKDAGMVRCDCLDNPGRTSIGQNAPIHDRCAGTGYVQASAK